MSNVFWFRLLKYGHFCDSCKLNIFLLKGKWYRLDIAANIFVKLLVLHQTFFLFRDTETVCAEFVSVEVESF